MKNFLKNLLKSLFVFSLMAILIMPFTVQANLFDDPLSRIQDKNQNIIDYSKSKVWGDLDQSLVSLLEVAPFVDIQALLGKSKIEGLADLQMYRDRLIQSRLSAVENDFNQQLKDLQEELIPDRTEIRRVQGEFQQALQQAGQAATTEFLDEIENAVGSEPERDRVLSALQSFGESQISSVILEVANFIRNFVAIIAIMWIVYSGIRLATANGDETVMKEQISAITWAVAGLILILLAERMINIVYYKTGPGVAPGTARDTLTDLPTQISDEVLALIRWIKIFVGSLAVVMIILNGMQTIASEGEEDKTSKTRRSILWIVAGIILIIVNQVFIENLYQKPVETAIIQAIQNDQNGRLEISQDQITTGNVSKVISIVGTVLKFGLGFVGLMALGLLVYAGATMALNWGSEEMVTNAQKIAVNALIGIIIVISSYALVATVIL